MRDRPAPLPVALLPVVIAASLLAGCSGSQSAPPAASNDPATPTAVTSIPVDPANRSGWILLEHVGAEPASGRSGPDTRDGASLWLIRPDGTELHELAPGLPADGKTNPTWSPEGRRVAFGTVGPRQLVYEMYASGGIPATIGQDCSGLLTGRRPCVEASPAYAPGGDQLATVVSFDGQATEAVYVRQRYEANPLFPSDRVCSPTRDGCFHLGYTLEGTEVATATAWIENLSWSPDGTQIAYDRVARDADGNPLASSELWVVNIDGGQANKIALPGDLVAWDPAWSPDGAAILFSAASMHEWNAALAGEASDVYTVRPDGSDLQRLTTDNTSRAASWTSDSLILFYSPPFMLLMKSDGSNVAPILANAPALRATPSEWAGEASWQPAP